MKADFEIKRLEGRRRWKRRAAYAVRVTAGSDAAAAAFARRLAFGGLNGRRVLGRLRPRDQSPQTGLRGRQRAPEAPRPRAGGAGVRREDSSPPSPRKDADPGGAGPRLWPRFACRHPDSRWGQGLEPTQREGPPWGPRGHLCNPPAAGGAKAGPLRSAPTPSSPRARGTPARGDGPGVAGASGAELERCWAMVSEERRPGGGEGSPAGGETREAARAERSAGDRAGKDCRCAHGAARVGPRASCRPGKARLGGLHAARQRVSRSRRDDPVEAGLSSVSGRLGRLGRAEPGDRP